MLVHLPLDHNKTKLLLVYNLYQFPISATSYEKVPRGGAVDSLIIREVYGKFPNCTYCYNLI